MPVPIPLSRRQARNLAARQAYQLRRQARNLEARQIYRLRRRVC